MQQKQNRKKSQICLLSLFFLSHCRSSSSSFYFNNDEISFVKIVFLLEFRRYLFEMKFQKRFHISIHRDFLAKLFFFFFFFTT